MKIKVRCINSKGLNGALTKGKVYEVINSWSDFYIVINNNGIQDTYAKNRFEVVEEITVHIGVDIGISEPIIQQTIVVRKIEELDGLENGMGLEVEILLGYDRVRTIRVIANNNEYVQGNLDVEGACNLLKAMGFKLDYKPKRTEEEIMSDLIEKEFKFGEGNFLLIKLENGKWDYMNNTSHYVPDKKYYTLDSAKIVVKELNELLESENNV
ncbi:DUF6501 family protein [Cetobacterium somerae]